MKYLIILGVLAVGMFLTRRMLAGGAGPAVRERFMEMCDRMLDGMPESFPPNRMMADLAAVRQQTARILELLEESQAADKPKSKPKK